MAGAVDRLQTEETEEPTTPTRGMDGADDSRSLLVNQANKYRSLRVRAASTVAMVGTFLVIVYLGHVPLMLMIFVIQTVMVKELFLLARAAANQHPKNPPKMVKQQWYFFAVAAFWIYGRFIKDNLMVEITSSRQLARLFGWALTRHTVLAFTLYSAGFVVFVLKLKRGHYMFQFGQYAWTHMILMVVFIPSSFFVSNIFDGLIWFLLPCSLVIINDIGAYLAGFFLGRTPLIKLSPKKTVEGFVGGLLLTVAASWYLARLLSSYKWMTCPRTDLSLGRLDCEPDPMFQPTVFSLCDLGAFLPDAATRCLRHLRALLPPEIQDNVINPFVTATIVALPMQLHAVVLALFASLAAPFGGFFASGFKRGFKIKDFGDSIPGHGGMTDRMDCQIVMAVFSYIYYNNYVSRQTMTVGGVLARVLQLDRKEQIELFGKLGNMLGGQDMISDELVKTLAALRTAPRS